MSEETQKQFPEDLLQEISKSKTPEKIIHPVIYENFKFLGAFITEEDSKSTLVICDFFIDSFAYFKYKLDFTFQQVSVFLDIVLQLLLYSIKNTLFNKESDMIYLLNLALPYSQGMNPLFPKALMDKALDHMNLTYFNHYNLYKFLFTETRTEENIMSLLDIDLPLPLPPHSTSVQRIYKKPQEIVEKPETPHEIEAEKAKESLKERLLKKMEDTTRERFLDKIAEARDAMSKQIEQRDKMLKQKWDDLEKELKRKRRRG